MGVVARRSHLHPADIQALSRLAIEATTGVTDLAETLHQTIARTAGVSVAPQIVAGPLTGLTKLAYGSVRGATRLVGNGLELIQTPLVALLGARRTTPQREAVIAALNGVLGDHLDKSRNRLAIPLRLRQNGEPVALTREGISNRYPQPRTKLLVLVHGLCLDDLRWSRQDARVEDDGVASGEGTRPAATVPAMALELGYSVLTVHYNSGRHVSLNGRELAATLETLLACWPETVEELSIVGHSMGGLVTRSACHYATVAGASWVQRLRTLVFLGTPHHGAPLERAGNWVDTLLGATPFSAPFSRLGKIRSAGITDLRHGNLLDEDWEGRDRFTRSADRRQRVPLPAGVNCHALAACTDSGVGKTQRPGGDGLVPIASAFGQHADPQLHLQIPAANCWVGYGMGHLELLHNPLALARLRHCLSQPQ